MASNGNSRGGLLSAGGVLSVIAGISQIISGLLVAGFIFRPDVFHYLPELGLRLSILPFLPDFLWQRILMELLVSDARMLFLSCTGVMGIVAITGGISTIRRKRFSLSLAGAICALPSVLLGLLAIIFVSVSKREFGASEVNGK